MTIIASVPTFSVLFSSPTRLRKYRIIIWLHDLPRTLKEAQERMDALRKKMFAAAKDLEFERAAEMRDAILRLEALALEL